MNPFDQLDPIEDSLRELADAERARLFCRTRVDARSLLHSASKGNYAFRVSRRTRWVSIAAAVVLAVSICGWIFTVGRNSTRITPFPSGMIASASGACDSRFFSCLTGPSGRPSVDCGVYDFDTDGDIDLADAGAYQRRCTGISR